MYNEQLVKQCQQHMNKYVVMQTTDGQHIDGIVESVDQHNVYLIVPVEGAVAAAANQPMHGMNAPVAAAVNQPIHAQAAAPNMPMREEERAFVGGLTGYGGLYPGYGVGAPGFGAPGIGAPGFGAPGFGAPGFGYGYGYGFPGYGYGFGYPRRRLARVALPLAALLALTAVPFV